MDKVYFIPLFIFANSFKLCLKKYFHFNICAVQFENPFEKYFLKKNLRIIFKNKKGDKVHLVRNFIRNAIELVNLIMEN